MSVAADIMRVIHGRDVYAGFVPVMAPDWQGFNSQHPMLAEAASRATVIVDVGVWKGASTAFLAKQMQPHQPNGCVIAIDTFLGSVEHSLTDSTLFPLIPRRHGLPMLYEQFLTNMVTDGLSYLVVPFAQTTSAAAEIMRRLKLRADLIHIDAAHDYGSVRDDIHAYWRLLNPGGTLLGDDYSDSGSWPGVKKAVDEFSAELGLPLTISSPKWRIDRPL